MEEEDKEHSRLKKKEESEGIWPAGVCSPGSPRSSGRELAQGPKGGEWGGKICRAQKEKLQSSPARPTPNKREYPGV